jgi:hypothetical protein
MNNMINLENKNTLNKITSLKHYKRKLEILKKENVKLFGNMLAGLSTD